MALQTITTVDNVTTDAAFRAWGSALSAKLAALGFVQTADTGQVNWTTVTKPTAISTVAGYEIWRFNDTLQSTAPIFFKIEYGTPAGSASGLNLWVTAGTATDGAGSITSSATFSPLVTVASRQSLMGASNNTVGAGGSGNEYLWAESSGGGALGVLMWPSINEGFFAGMFFGIERFRNLDGTASGDGFMLYTARAWTSSAGGASSAQAVYLLAGATQPTATNWPVLGLNATPTSNIVGTTLYPLPVFTGWYTPRLYGPSQMLLAYPRSDMATGGNTFTLSHYGSSRTWLTAGSTANVGGWMGSIAGSTGWSFAMRGD